MQYSDVLQFVKSVDKVNESTKAVMLWVAPEEGSLTGSILGEPKEILRIYKSIFLGILPMAREQGWLKD